MRLTSAKDLVEVEAELGNNCYKKPIVFYQCPHNNSWYANEILNLNSQDRKSLPKKDWHKCAHAHCVTHGHVYASNASLCILYWSSILWA